MTTLGSGKHVPAPIYLTLLLLLNAIPLYGVLFLNWQAFDLIFLYWLENWLIGIVMLLKIIARPLSNPVELGVTLFMVPFFAFHYGMFCTVHGVFLFALLGDGVPFNDNAMVQSVFSLISDRQLLFSVLALAIWQLVDWVRDLIEMGPGKEGIQELTAGPYQRIVVLHLTILFSGFVLIALDQPTSGLVLLVVIKTAFEFFNWRKQEKKVDTEVTVDDALMSDFSHEFPRPVLKVRNQEIEFATFAALTNSKAYERYLAMHRFRYGHQAAWQLNEYLTSRAAQENRLTS